MGVYIAGYQLELFYYYFEIKLQELISDIQWPGWPNGLGSGLKFTFTDHCSLSPIQCELMSDFVQHKVSIFRAIFSFIL